MKFMNFFLRLKYPQIREKEIEDRMKSILESSIREGTLTFFLPGTITISVYMVLMCFGVFCLVNSYSFSIHPVPFGGNEKYGFDPFLVGMGIGFVSIIFSGICMLFILQGKINWVKVLRKYTGILLLLQLFGVIVIFRSSSLAPLWLFALGLLFFTLCHRMICSTRVYMFASFFLAKREMRDQQASIKK